MVLEQAKIVGLVKDVAGLTAENAVAIDGVKFALRTEDADARQGNVNLKAKVVSGKSGGLIAQPDAALESFQTRFGLNVTIYAGEKPNTVAVSFSVQRVMVVRRCTDDAEDSFVWAALGRNSFEPDAVDYDYASDCDEIEWEEIANAMYLQDQAETPVSEAKPAHDGASAAGPANQQPGGAGGGSAGSGKGKKRANEGSGGAAPQSKKVKSKM
jgi:hypothetical protein